MHPPNNFKKFKNTLPIILSLNPSFSSYISQFISSQPQTLVTNYLVWSLFDIGDYYNYIHRQFPFFFSFFFFLLFESI